MVFFVVVLSVFLWWCFCCRCFCGGVFVVVFLLSVFCGGVFVVGVFVVVFLWWCGGVCFGGGVFVFLWRCSCGGVFCQGSTFVALPRSYAKCVDSAGVKKSDIRILLTLLISTLTSSISFIYR